MKYTALLECAARLIYPLILDGYCVVTAAYPFTDFVLLKPLVYAVVVPDTVFAVTKATTCKSNKNFAVLFR